MEARSALKILALLVESYCGPDRRVLSCFRAGTAVVEGPIRSRPTGRIRCDPRQRSRRYRRGFSQSPSA
ncbi:hypothetical protein MPLSOD_40459 [Mesorhizobium sp. SOD10]|nr:hypothetical protein MPLSOD_40459 [Mesorhizobium sp. SOD10]